jgi:hypothetical protein
MFFSYIPTVYKSWYTRFIHFYERTEKPGIDTGNFLTTEDQLAAQEGLRSVELLISTGTQEQ